MSVWKSFMYVFEWQSPLIQGYFFYHLNHSGSLRRYGQLSGVVEPIAGVLGALAVSIATPLLPYALAFAAGAMIYVVVDDIIPEAHTWFVHTHLKCTF